jgi:adenylate cyclase
MVKRYRILIVEDSKITGKLLLKNLNKSFNENESEIVLVEDLQHARKELQDNSYEYIVLDLHLPDGEGTSLITFSSKIKGFNGKFIVFTASEDEKLRERLYTAGVLDFILKSGDISNIAFEITELIKQVEQYSLYTILIVDDALFFRNMLKNVFISRNYKVLLAKNGAEALQVLEQSKVDLIIMDYNMPVLDGKGFLEKRRKTPNIYQIPTLIVTGESDRNTISALLKLGANDVIQKPFVVEEIVTKIDNLIQILIFQKEKDNLTFELERNITKLNDINKKLSKYLSPQLHSSIFENKELRVDSVRKKLTIFFSDIQGFTETTEEMEPEDLTYILNSYLTEMSNIAIKHGATIDKFIGDAIVAFFGDPKSRGVKEDAVSCVLMAIDMRDKLKELQTKWHNEGFVRPFNSRIGINTGYVTVGNFGSENKMEYTAIGSNMNLAARLESSSKAGEILISHETYLLVKDRIETIYMGDIEAKGFHKPIRTYRVSKPMNREILSAKTDGFFVNVDYATLKDRDIVLDIIEDIKDNLVRLKNENEDEEQK